MNKLVRAAMEQNPPPLFHNRRPKIYYATQVAVQPPTIVLFCNDPKALSTQYQRYLLRVFRDEAAVRRGAHQALPPPAQHGDERDGSTPG